MTPSGRGVSGGGSSASRGILEARCGGKRCVSDRDERQGREDAGIATGRASREAGEHAGPGSRNARATGLRTRTRGGHERRATRECVPDELYRDGLRAYGEKPGGDTRERTSRLGNRPRVVGRPREWRPGGFLRRKACDAWVGVAFERWHDSIGSIGFRGGLLKVKKRFAANEAIWLRERENSSRAPRSNANATRVNVM